MTCTLYVSQDLYLKDSAASSFSKLHYSSVGQLAFIARPSKELAYQGSIVYLNDTKVMRASIINQNGNNTIQVK
jgi:hypothetical protein